MAGFLTHDNKYHMFLTGGPKENPKLNDLIKNITSVSAIGLSRDSTDMTDFSSIGEDKAFGTPKGDDITVAGNLVEGQLQYFYNLFYRNQKVFVWIVEYDEDNIPQNYMRFWANVSAVQRSDASVNGTVGWSVTLAPSGVVFLSAFVDPLGASSGIPITQLTVEGKGGKKSIEVGETLVMTCDIEPFDATNPSVEWSVDQPDTAVINIGGILMGLKAGSVEVTASAQDGSGVTGKTSITVTGGED